ncbi:MAG TPA: acetyl-CoA decarbonylase/synthase complex subunit gamma [Armatimonadota bacterium]|jgi:acetyl-CoA decarbonylase/synthase complex subunit gamma
MAMTGLDIFKLLPKTNCKECGVPTCMAFAMKLASKSAELSACPYASEEAQEKIGAASRPPMRTVTLGPAERPVVLGGETVMFRHEKTFVHPTAIAVSLPDTLPVEELRSQAAAIASYCLERVGEELRVDLILVDNVSGDPTTFVEAVKAVRSAAACGLVLKSESPRALREAGEQLQGERPLLYCATPVNADALAEVAKLLKAPLVARADTVEELAGLAAELARQGVEDLVLEAPAGNPAALLQQNTLIRKSALKSAFRPLGFPLLNTVTGRDPVELVADASTSICKYASVMVIDSGEPEVLLPLLMLRQNVFTDPQKPIQVEPGVYPIGDAGPDSPVLVTTNFSLTYFIVSSEAENAGVPVHLAVVESEGMSVLTAWAAGKFSAEKIAAFLKSQPAMEGLTTRRVVVPGYVSQISGELEDGLPGWEVLVGPQEASDITPFLRTRLAASAA